MKNRLRCPRCSAFVSQKGISCKRCSLYLDGRTVVRPWTSVAPALPIDVILNPEIDIEGLKLLSQMLLPWDSRFGMSLDPILDWRMILNLYVGLEMPLNSSRWVQDDNPFGTDWPEHPFCHNSGDLAIQLVGFEGHDPLHNALLICAGAGTSNRVNAIKTANLIYYMATSAVVGNVDREVENILRGWSGQIILQDAAFAVFDFYGVVFSTSREWEDFFHNSWLRLF